MSVWDDTQARSEGWLIKREGWTMWPVGFIKDSRRKTIGVYSSDLDGYDSCTTLAEMDQCALAFVQQKAAEGSAYHIDALARIQLL